MHDDTDKARTSLRLTGREESFASISKIRRSSPSQAINLIKKATLHVEPQHFKKMQNRDDIPVGGKEAYPEFSEASETLALDDAGGPLESRVVSKTWSVRCAAYKEVAYLLAQGQTPPQFLALLPKFVGDTNPAAQEAGLAALTAVLEASPEAVLPQASELTSALVEKAMTSAKPMIKQAASDALLKFVSVHSSEPSDILGVLAAAFANKNLKVQSSAASAYASLLAQFGPQYLSLKTFVPLMESLAGSSNAGVRAEASNCFKEAFRWVRDAIMPAVDRLKKVQADELKRNFEEITEPPTKKLFMRHESQARQVEGKKAAPPRPMDAYELSQPKDIFSQFNDAWVDSVLELSKWADKKQALDTLNSEADVPRLAERSPAHLVSLAKRLVVDSNFNVQMQAVRLCGLLARGQQRYFEAYARQLLPFLTAKFREKKAPMVQEAHTALLYFLKSLSIEDMLEDLKASLSEKTPGAKINCALWIAASVDQIGERMFAKVGRELVEMISKNSSDSAGDVRTATQKVLQELSAKLGTASEARPEIKIEETKKEVKILSSRPTTAPKPKAKIVSAPKVASSTGKKPISQVCNDDEVTGILTGDDAENQLQEVLPGSIFANLKLAGWKDKSQALTDLLEWIKSNTEQTSRFNEAVVRLIKFKLKEWKENNCIVNKSALECITALAAQCDLTKRTASYVLTAQALEMLGDAKLNATYMACLFALSEVVGPRFVAGQIVKNTTECGKPKVAAESSNALAKLVSEYGAHTMSLKDLIDYAKNGINNSNPTIKKAAQGLLVTLYSYLGDTLVAQLNDVKEATLKVLTQEFSQTEVIREKTFKAIRGEETKLVDARSALEASLPRADISSKITSRILGEFTDTNWKTRKAAMDFVLSLLEENAMRIQATGLKDLAKALGSRLADSNKSLVRTCLNLVKVFAEALGSECKEFGRFIVPGLISSFGDKQTLVRQEALAAVDKWAQEGGTEVIISNSYSFLQQDNPELRAELLQWLLNHKADLGNSDLQPYLPGVLACLQDRVSSIRASAEVLLGEILGKTGYDALSPLLKSIKPAVLNALKPVLDKYKTETLTEPESEKPRPATAQRPTKAALVRTSSSRVVGKSPSRPLTAKTSATPASRKEPLSESFTITSKGNKDKRLDIDSRSRLSVEELRDDISERIKDCLRQSVSPDLCTQLLSPDFKKQCIGLKHLSELVADLDHTIDILDVILRYFYLRLMESANTQVTKAILEILTPLVNNLAEAGYTLHEAEASVLIPILCEKSGQNNAGFRQQFRQLIVSCCLIFPPGRVFSYVLQGLNSKNTRSKVECLESLAVLIQQQGLSVAQPRDYKVISRFVSHADSSVRNSAVNVIAEAFKLAPDKIWQLIGDVTDKSRDILDQRFKTICGTTTLSSGKPKPSGGKTPKTPMKLTFEPIAEPHFAESSSSSAETRLEGSHRAEVQREALRVIETPSETARTVEHLPLKPKLELKVPKSGANLAEESKIPEMAIDFCLSNDSLLYDENDVIYTPKAKTELDNQIDILRDGDLSNRVDALVKINDMIPNEEHREEFRRKANYLLDALSKVMVSTFNRPTNEVPLLFAKYFLNVLHKVCATKFIMREASEEALYDLAEQLLLRLLTEGLDKLGKSNEGDVMLKMMNGAMLRILEFSQPTKVFCVLFQLLTKYKGSNSKAKMNSLVIRCVIKLTKVLGSIIQHLEVGRLMVSMHEYLSEPNPTDDAGAKTIKTILQELVKLQQEQVWDAYEAVRRHEQEDHYIEGWLKANFLLNTGLNSRSRNPLVPIFQRIAEPENYSEALRQLSDYLERNPEVDVSNYLQELSDELSERVTDDLRALKPQEDKEQDSNFRIQEFQTRLAAMKKKYGLVANANAPQMSITLTDLKAKVAKYANC